MLDLICHTTIFQILSKFHRNIKIEYSLQIKKFQRKFIVEMTGNQIITKPYHVELSSANIINLRSLMITNFVGKYVQVNLNLNWFLMKRLTIQI